MGWGLYREEEFCFTKKVVRILYRLLYRMLYKWWWSGPESRWLQPTNAQREGNVGTTVLAAGNARDTGSRSSLRSSLEAGHSEIRVGGILGRAVSWCADIFLLTVSMHGEEGTSSLTLLLRTLIAYS